MQEPTDKNNRFNSNKQSNSVKIISVYALSLYPKAKEGERTGSPLAVQLIGTKVKFTQNTATSYIQPEEFNKDPGRYRVQTEFYMNQLLGFITGVKQRALADNTDFQASIVNHLDNGKYSTLVIKRENGDMFIRTGLGNTLSERTWFPISCGDCEIKGLENTQPFGITYLDMLHDVIVGVYSAAEFSNYFLFDFNGRDKEF